MDGHRSLVVLVALLAIGALSVAAGALPAALETATGQQGGGAGSSGSEQVIVAEQLIVSALIVGLLVASFLAYRARELRSIVERAAGKLGRQPVVDADDAVLAVALCLGLLLLLAASLILSEPLSGGEPPDGPGSEDIVPSGPDWPRAVAIPLVVVGVAVVAILLHRRRSVVQGDDGEGGSMERSDDAAASALGRTAGRAADKLDEPADDNAVYWAWQEMAALLDPDDPETTTPREFASRAMAAGLTRDDVEDLTRLFETVRYGDRQATADRERRARDLLRRIETTYAGTEAATDPDTTGDR